MWPDERQISEIPINLFPWDPESTGRPIDLGWMDDVDSMTRMMIQMILMEVMVSFENGMLTPTCLKN